MTHSSTNPFARLLCLILLCSFLPLTMAGCSLSNTTGSLGSNSADAIQTEVVEFEEVLGAVDQGLERYPSPDARRFTMTDDGELWSLNGPYLIHWKVAEKKYQLFKKPADSGQITAISASGNAILLGTDAGEVLRFEQEIYTALYNLDNGTYIQTILSGSDGTIWLGTNQGVVRLNADASDVFNYPLEGLADGFIHSLFLDSQGQLWAGTVDAVSVWMDEHWMTYRLQKGETVLTIAETAAHQILAASGDVLYRLDGEKWQTVSLPPSGEISSMTTSADGRIALIGAAGKLVQLDPVSGTYTAAIIPSAVSIAASQNGRLVIGSLEHGLLYSDGGTWQQISSAKQLPGANTLSLDPTGSGEGWIGTENGLAFQPKLGPVLSIAETKGDAILSAAADNPGSLWFQTSSAIGRKVGEDIQYFPYGNDRNNHPISDMVMSPDGTLWYLTRNGLVQMVNGERQVIDTPFSRPDINTHILPIPIMIDSIQMVWLALPDGQIYSYGNGEWGSLLLPIDEEVTAIYVVSVNDVWVGTTHSGLFHHKDDNWSVFDLPGKEIQPMVTCITAAGGNLLVGSAEGLFKVQDPGGENPIISTTAWNADNIHSLAADETHLWVGYHYGGAEKISLNLLE